MNTLQLKSINAYFPLFCLHLLCAYTLLDNEEELLGFFDAFQGVSSRLQPLDKKQFINLCEKLGTL